MVRTTFTRVFVLAASAAVFTSIAAAQVKLAVVNMQQALLATAEIKKASADLETKYKPRQAQMDTLRRELADIQQKLQAGQDKLTPQAQSELNAQGQRKQRDLQRLGQDLQEEADAERQDILSKSSQRMIAVVKKLAEDRGLDVVVDVTSTLYIKPALDLTKDATAEYDKAYPAQ